MAKITIFVPDQEPARYGIGDAEQISIGRAPECDITVDHSSVSGQHAFIRQIGAGLHMLIDNGSRNGIFLEGNQVTEGPLSNGASFHIGQVPASYEGDEEEVQAPESQPDSTSSSVASSGLGGSSSGEGGYGAPIAPVADMSARPPGFKDMSPIERVEKKDTLATVAMIVGGVAILGALVLALFTVMMNAGG